MIAVVMFLIAFMFCSWLSYSYLRPYINNKPLDN
ncbi:component of virus entry-fusion complex [Murmansk poxvirus]|uniref:Component of virus entry-fusion complex n=1 Tax=Murmansk poxvirus TaxID=2025359 RepID=A0A223FMP8_9POXV|nr:component of virus entry-fusion complex [Murmansk poxvirus]YP_009408449.1 Virus entry/fusion complex component [NY_014 poxvirus]AST09260.1 component of virus entry-fusion complex [Murmansk poxvirus]AST09462.1 Virus entry/fusion complex component [NY_014 poxvirus]